VNQPTDLFGTVLAEQIQCAQAMLRALEAENRALVDGDAERLNAASAAKARLVEELEALEAERRGLADALDASVTWLAHAPKPAWQALLTLVAECKQQNQRNGALVKARSEHLRTALKLLRGSEPTFYDPSGLAQAARSARSLGTA
jgi:flagella synthesis protein FlgN